MSFPLNPLPREFQLYVLEQGQESSPLPSSRRYATLRCCTSMPKNSFTSSPSSKPWRAFSRMI
jgi:hypothetical protein